MGQYSCWIYGSGHPLKKCATCFCHLWWNWFYFCFEDHNLLNIFVCQWSKNEGMEAFILVSDKACYQNLKNAFLSLTVLMIISPLEPFVIFEIFYKTFVDIWKWQLHNTCNNVFLLEEWFCYSSFQSVIFTAVDITQCIVTNYILVW